MIRKVIVGSIEAVIILMAAYTFFFVNIGRRTPYGHLAAILSTQPAHEAAEDIKKSGKKLEGKVVDEVKGQTKQMRRAIEDAR